MSASRHLNTRQFADVFHGTDEEAVEGIRAEGLHPAEGLPSVYTVAYDHDTAEEYAHDAADYRGSRPAVIHFRLPSDEWHGKYQGDFEDFGHSQASGLRETLPARYIHKVTYPKPQGGGYYKARGG